MIEFSRLTVLILAELLLGMGLVTLVLISMAVIRKHKAYKAAQRLVERIRLDTEPRSERLRQKLSGVFGYQGDTLQQLLHSLNRVEKQLYQNIINGFLKRDLVAFQQIDVDVDNLVLAYQGLEPTSGQSDSAGSESATSGSESEEIDRLQAENQLLSDELKITMDTMARMISEYAYMFTNEMSNQANAESVFLAGDEIDEPAGGDSVETLPAEELDTTSNIAQTSAGSETAVVAEAATSGDEAALDDDQPERLEAVGQAEEQVAEEVLEVADDFSDLVVDAMSRTSESDPEPEPQRHASLVDELELVDISSMELDEEVNQGNTEAASLEEEWAKLLEDEAHSVQLEQSDEQAKPN